MAAEIPKLKALRLLRLFRLMKMGRLVKKWQSAWGISYGNVALLKFAFLTVMAVHWMSCMWGWLSQFSQRTWLTQLIESKNLNKDEIEFFTKPAHVYAVSLYWAVMTLTSLGYGDIVAINMKEYMFCIFCFVTSGLIWAYVIGSICGIISAMDPLLLQYQQNMDLLNIMMQDNQLPEDMRRRLRLYFQESRNLQRKVNQQTVVATLSPGLQGELAMKISQMWLTRVWYFDVLDADPVIEISKRLKPMIFADGEPLMLNNNNRTLFIVIRGVAARAGVVLGKNAVIGDDMIISNPYLRNSARPNCITFVEVNYLRNEHLDEVRQAFPLAEQRIRKAQIKWAMHRGFVLAAWHRVSCGGNLAGPRTTAYFKNEVPSFNTVEAVEAYSAEVTPRGSTSLMQRRQAGGALGFQRRNSLGITGMGLAAIGGMGLGMVPIAAAPPQGCGRNTISLPRGGGQGLGSESPALGSPGRGRRQRGSINAPFAVAAAAAPVEDQSVVLDMLATIRTEVNEGIERLEARLERVERRVNPSMLG